MDQLTHERTRELAETRWAIVYPNLLQANSARPEHVVRYARAAEILARTPPGPLLDLACGCGYGTRLLADALPGHVPVWGLDIEASLLFYAAEFYRRAGINFAEADLEKGLGEADGRLGYAGIALIEAIEHLDSPCRLLSDIGEQIRPDGLLVVSTPRRPQGNPWHKREYRGPELLALLDDYGFLPVLKQQQAGSAFSDWPVDPEEAGPWLFVAAQKQQ